MGDPWEPRKEQLPNDITESSSPYESPVAMVRQMGKYNYN